MIHLKLCVAACVVFLEAGVVAAAQEAPVVGLDHIPVAVKNLGTAAARYRALGFSLKPGRPHSNGIRNQHVKFSDGTELELITAPEARDELTRFYRRQIAAGDGPAFVAFYAPEADAVVERLDAVNERHRRDGMYVEFPAEDALRYVFFGPRNRSPTDRPEHFAHANSAESLTGVWLAGDDLSRERRLLEAVGATVAREDVRVPDAVSADVAYFAEGLVVFLPGSRQLVPGRRIVGATVRVRSLEAVRRSLRRSGLPVPPTVSNIRGSSVFLAPAITHGIWLELREAG